MTYSRMLNQPKENIRSENFNTDITVWYGYVNPLLPSLACTESSNPRNLSAE